MRAIWAVLALSLLLVLALTPAQASASQARREILKPISKVSPYPDDCGPDIEAAGLGDDVEDAETEAAIAVDPRNPRRLVAAWGQDLYKGYVASRSADGGRSWKAADVPGNSACSSSDLDIAADPWLSIGAGGTAYLAGFSLDLPNPGTPVPFRSQLQVNTSTNHGRTWSEPSVVAGGIVANHDQPSVTADPAKPGTAFVVWQEFIQALVPSSFELRFSRTLDGARSWSAPVPALVSGPQALGAMLRPELLVLPDGSLLVTVVLLQPSVVATYLPLPLGVRPTYSILAVRSDDGGRSWSAPTRIVEFDGGGGLPCSSFRDPETGELIQSCEPFYGADVAPDGSVYITWSHALSAKASEIRVVRSRDHGSSWSEPRTVSAAGTQMFLPAVAVSGDGTVGATYYDVRNDRPGDRPYSADIWFAHSHDRGRTWRERHLAGPFDLRRAVYRKIPVEGLYLGDDPHGLVGLPAGFASALTMAEPRARAGASDVFFARVRTKPRR